MASLPWSRQRGWKDRDFRIARHPRRRCSISLRRKRLGGRAAPFDCAQGKLSEPRPFWIKSALWGLLRAEARIPEIHFYAAINGRSSTSDSFARSRTEYHTWRSHVFHYLRALTLACAAGYFRHSGENSSVCCEENLGASTHRYAHH